MDRYYSIHPPVVLVNDYASIRFVGRTKVLTLELSDYDVIALRDRLMEIVATRRKHIDYISRRMGVPE